MVEEVVLLHHLPKWLQIQARLRLKRDSPFPNLKTAGESSSPRDPRVGIARPGVVV
ncbi:hypothetical protein [Isosphaera pallida]|uniref:hypothetical protein n=1 Tax=Isosphaera pallida TaxID=128 RepID=UPI00030C68C1|nr:hypothetical protein [Isosphaera pallida]